MTADALAAWMTKPQAAAALGVSVRSVVRYAESGRIERQWRKSRGTRTVAVFNPADVAGLADELAAAGGALPAIVRVPAPAPIVTIPNVNLDAFAAAIGHAVADALAPRHKDLLTLPEAMALGYPRRWLRERIRAGDVRRVGKRISRPSLEALIRP